MPFSRHGSRLFAATVLAGCGVFAALVPALAARAPSASIELSYKGRMYLNLNAGTQQLEQDVTLRQAPDTLIRADKAEGSNLPDGDYDNGHWKLSGQVHIEFNGVVLDADSATVAFADGRIRSINVLGKPARFSHPAGATGQRNEGRAANIAYDGNTREVRFSGRTAYAFGPYEGTADKPLVYELDTTVIRSEAGTDDSRIMFSFRNMQASARNWRANIDKGTQLLELDVELRQAAGTLITAGKAEGKNLLEGYDNGQWTLSQQVRIEHDDAILEAASGSVTFAAGRARSMQALGTPARFSFPTGRAGKRFTGRADSIRFDVDAREVRVVGKPSRYTLGLDEASSDKPLLYLLDGGILKSDSTGDGGRIRGSMNSGAHVPTPRTPPRGTAQ